MTKKLIALFATLPVVTLGAAGLALADGDVNITNVNTAIVENSATTIANTGGNTAMGGNGGMAGNGGAVLSSDDGNMGGNGGNGGKGGNGGTVITGDAFAGTKFVNQVNTNDTEVNRCACNGEEDGDDNVVNVNVGLLGNAAATIADSGSNMTDGGMGGDAGNGGNVEDSDDDNVGGNGGAGNAGGNGGSTTTGMANAWTEIINIVNTNLTRILR